MNAPLQVKISLDIPDAVNRFADEFKSDLVVIGRGAAAGARLKPTAYSIVRQSPCPVVSI